MAEEALQELLVDNLRDLLDAEKQIQRALPKMARKASSEELSSGLEAHLRQTEGQIERLNQAFELLEEPARGKKCAGMQGLIEEGQEHMQGQKGAGLDAVIIASAQKVEHYEMAAYGTVRTWANQLGHNEVASLLEQTLDEEKATDKQLTELAESMVNPQAAAANEEAEEAPEQRGRTASRARTMAAERGGPKSSGGSSGSRSGSSRSSSSASSRGRKRSG